MCPAGKFTEPPFGALECTPCPAGTFKCAFSFTDVGDVDCADHCNLCPVGRFSASE